MDTAKSVSMVFLMALLAFSVSGCSAKIFNAGYDTDFYECPRNDNGQCMSVEDAHMSAVEAQINKENALVARYGGEAGYGVDGDDFEDQKPLDVLIKQLEKCAGKKDSECVKKTKKEIAVYERRTEDRAVARKAFKEDMEEQTVKMAMLQKQAASEPGMPFRTGDKLMELTLIPYETESGALASSRKFWLVVEEGSWSFDTIGKSKPKHVIGGLR